jgi:hypothetical protein
MSGRSWLAPGLVLCVLASGGEAALGDSGTPLVWVQGGGALLAAAVRDGRAVALDRLQERAECRDLFADHGADGVRLLRDASYRKADSEEAGGLCGKGAAAFTRMRSGRTALCADSFQKLGRYRAAVVLLHEALHTAGLGEAPHPPGAQTAREIDRMVRRSCGL